MKANKTRAFKALQDARDLIISELAKPDVPQDQRTALILELAKLQREVSNRRKRAGISGVGKGGRRKGGRPKKMHDSEGNPLYNKSPKLKQDDDIPSKKKFLEEITGGPVDTQEGS